MDEEEKPEYYVFINSNLSVSRFLVRYFLLLKNSFTGVNSGAMMRLKNSRQLLQYFLYFLKS